MKHGMWFPAKYRMTAVVFLLTFVLSLFNCVPLFSQGGTAGIAGTITDASGGAVAGATVTVTDVNRGTTRTLTTDESGSYNAPKLIPSNYTVRAEFKGFKATERRNIALEVGQSARVDLTLQPGEQAQTITVTEELPLVETTNAQLGGTIQNEVLNDLPLNGRNFTNMLDLRPGITKYPGGSGWTQSSNGLRPHDNYYLMNGVNSNDPWMAQSILNTTMAAGDAGTILPVDAIDQFRTIQNPQAEYGWKPGSVVDIGVKSGTNSLHGTAYAYGRSDAFDAREFFNHPNYGSPDKAPLQLQQFGGSAGGAIKKDRIFYFGNYEQQQYSLGNPAGHQVPITDGSGATTSAGLIGACLDTAAASRAPLSLQLAGLNADCSTASWYPGMFPVATGNAGDDFATTSTPFVTTTNTIHSGLGRLDFRVNDKSSLYGSFFLSQGNGTFTDNPTLQIAQPWLTDQFARSYVATGGWVWTPSSQWTNELRGGYSHYTQSFLSHDHTADPANYDFTNVTSGITHTYNLYLGQTNPAYRGFPQMLFQGYTFQLGLGWPKYVGPDGVFNLVEHVSYLRGTHTIMFGGEFLNLNSNNNVTQYTKSRVRFRNLASYFLGNMNQARFATGDFARVISSNAYAFFAQDSWRMKPRLVVNYGLRWEYNGVMRERDNLLGNFDPTAGLLQVGNGLSTPYAPDHKSWAPRLGIAWDMFGNGKTVLRAGAGIIYEQFSYDTFNALGNVIGLRTMPTGVTLAYGGDGTLGSGTVVPGSGNINTEAIFFTGPGQAVVNGNWQNNSADRPLFNATPACGDSNTPIAIPGGSYIPPPCVLLAVDRHIRNPYVSTWTLDLQRAITGSLSLDIAYVGNHGTKLLGLTDVNQPCGQYSGTTCVNGVGAGWNAAIAGCEGDSGCLQSLTLDDLRPADEVASMPFHNKFPYLGQINMLSNAYISNYNALQVALTQHTWHGLSYVLGYTYAHSLDMASDNWAGGGAGPAGLNSPINSYGNLKQQLYSQSVFDIRHRFTLALTYALPGINAPGQILKGWSVNSIVQLYSGMPWGVNDASTDFSGTNELSANNTQGEPWNFSGNRADFTSNRSLLNTNGGVGGMPYVTPDDSDWSKCQTAAAKLGGDLGIASLNSFNYCFVSPNGNSVLVPAAFGSIGNAGRDIFRGAPFRNWDFSVTKETKFKERLTAQFRVEFFNVLNHVNFTNVFGGPGGGNDFTDPSAAGKGWGFRPETPDITNSNPILGSGGPRAIQLGLKLIF